MYCISILFYIIIIIYLKFHMDNVFIIKLKFYIPSDSNITAFILIMIYEVKLKILIMVIYQLVCTIN